MRKTSGKSWSAVVVAAALAAVTIAVYLQVRNFDLISYDDYTYVTANPQVKEGLTANNFTWAFTAAQAHNWHPLTWLSLMLDSTLFGPGPRWFHLTNLLLHTANTILLFYVFVKMTKALWPGAFVAATFALHPLHIQSVAWVAERKDVLSSLFWLLTIVFYLRYLERQTIFRYVLTLLIFTLGLMAKPMLVSLPFILLLLDYWPLGRFHNSKFSILNSVIEKLPLFFLSAVSAIVTLIVQQRTGAVKDIVKFPFSSRIANALVSYADYIGKMFWPANLSIFYPHPGSTVNLSIAILSALLLLAVTAFVIRLARTHRYLLVGWLWYIVTLIPVIGIVQVGNQAMADRYTYIPLTGLFIIIAWGLPDLLAKYSFRKSLIAVAATAVLIAMSVSTYQQLRYWQNSITILEHAAEVTPNNRFAYANLGAVYFQRNMYDEAISYSNKALQIDPCDLMSQLNLGAALCRRGKINEGIVHFEKALQIDPCDVPTHLNLGVALTKQGKIQQAIEHYNEALRIDPCCTDALDLRQKLLQQQRH